MEGLDAGVCESVVVPFLAALKLRRDGEIGMRFGEVWLQTQGLAVLRDGPVQVALRPQVVAEDEVGGTGGGDDFRLGAELAGWYAAKGRADPGEPDRRELVLDSRQVPQRYLLLLSAHRQAGAAGVERQDPNRGMVEVGAQLSLA